jgi:hypothetical protein
VLENNSELVYYTDDKAANDASQAKGRIQLQQCKLTEEGDLNMCIADTTTSVKQRRSKSFMGCKL